MAGIDERQVVQSMMRMASPLLPLPRDQWLLIARNALRLGATDPSPRLAAKARPILRRAIADLSESARTQHLRAIGHVARALQLLELAHRHDEARRPRASDTAQRAAVEVFRTLAASEGGGSLDYLEADSVALWVFASAALINDAVVSLRAANMTPTYQRTMGTSHRWLEFFMRDRRADLNNLTANDPELSSFIPRLASALGMHPDQADSWEAFNRPRLEKACWCSRPGEFARRIWSQPSFSRWTTLLQTEADRVIMDDLIAIGGPRSDFLVLGDDVIGLGIAGAFDSLLVLALARATSEAASTWHETAVAHEMERSWSKAAEVTRNVPWVKLANAESRKPGQRTHHDGEIDVLVRIGNLLVDVQAKAARSTQYEQRAKLAVTAALKQHQSLRQAGQAGIVTMPVEQASGRTRLTIGPGALTHMPVTVGTEPVHGWPVGRVTPGTLPRILTTLDHLRTVNFFVPENYRPAYWIDRYEQQFDGLHFVTELDFLTNWMLALWGSGVRLAVTDEWNLVGASDSFLEMYVVAANTVLDAETSTAASEMMAPLDAYLRKQQPASTAPRFELLLRKLLRDRIPGAIAVSRFAFDSSRERIDDALSTGRAITLSAQFGQWVVSPEPLTAKQLRQDELDLALYRKLSGDWVVWERSPWGQSLTSNTQPIPRFSLRRAAPA